MKYLTSFPERDTYLSRIYHGYRAYVESYLDKLKPFRFSRWSCALILIIAFAYRIVMLRSFYLVAYVYIIIVLNQLSLYLKSDDLNANNSVDILPLKSDDQFQAVPLFIEINCWYTMFLWALISIACTFCDILNVPVYWPILLAYVIFLFVFTLIQHVRRKLIKQ